MSISLTCDTCGAVLKDPRGTVLQIDPTGEFFIGVYLPTNWIALMNQHHVGAICASCYLKLEGLSGASGDPAPKP